MKLSYKDESFWKTTGLFNHVGLYWSCFCSRPSIDLTFHLLSFNFILSASNPCKRNGVPYLLILSYLVGCINDYQYYERSFVSVQSQHLMTKYQLILLILIYFLSLLRFESRSCSMFCGRSRCTLLFLLLLFHPRMSPCDSIPWYRDTMIPYKNIFVDIKCQVASAQLSSLSKFFVI